MIPQTLTVDIVKSMFNEMYFQRGKKYHKDGRVTINDIIKEKNNTWTVTSEVQGSEPYSYDIEIIIKQKGNSLYIRGECDCPMSINCKHVVATLLTVIAQSGRLVQEINFQQMRRSIQVHSSESTQVERWLNKFEYERVPNIQNNIISYQLFYELSLTRIHDGQERIICRPQLFRMLKSGLRSKSKKSYLLESSNQIFFSENDRLLIGRLIVEEKLAHSYYLNDGAMLCAVSGETLLDDLLKTGKCFWTESEGEIKSGDTKNVSFHWHNTPEGTQKLQHDQESGLRLFCIHQLWYFDATNNVIGRANSNVPVESVKHVINMPSIPFNKAEQAYQKLEKLLPATLLPTIHKIKKTSSVIPIPCIHLAEKEIQIKNNNWSYKKERLPLVTVSFRYGAALIPWNDSNEIVHAVTADEAIEYKRNFSAENKALYYLAKTYQLNPIPLIKDVASSEKIANGFLLDQEQDPLRFTLDVLPELERAGWQIDIDNDYRYNIIDADTDDWFTNIEEEGSGLDWFGLELGIQLPSGEKINLLPILQRYLANPPTAPNVKNIIANLKDGRKIALPIERVRNAAEILIDIFNRTTGPIDKLRLSRFEAIRLAELHKAFNAAKMRWHGGQKLLELAQKLAQIKNIQEVTVPDIFHGQLRPYQQTGLNWLQFLREHQLSGILSDDMGLGKTIQAIAHITVEKNAGRLENPVLIVAPTSLMFNWQAELQRFSPTLKVLLLHGTQRKQHYDQISEYDVILTTYPLLACDKEILLQHQFHLIILDEAQAIKNFRTQAAQIVIQIPAKHRLCMTGTPMENHLGELWSLFHFMMPGFLGTEKQFRTLFRIPIEKNQDENRRLHLARIVSPFLLRRKKTDVAKELPDKIEMLQTVELDSGQRDLYETIRLSMQKILHESIKKLGLARSHIMILDALLKLRQICCDPRLLKENKQAHKLPSAKLTMLMAMLPELVEEGRRILLFSQFTGMLSLIEHELKKIQLPYVILTGQTRNRQKPVEDFQSGKAPIFLISLKAGGTGLNLTAADTVIHYDPWWNPAVENQATDRAHRIGQEKNVFVYRLVAQGTVEEKIVELQHRKHALAESLLNGSTKTTTTFSADDLQILLGPLDKE